MNSQSADLIERMLHGDKNCFHDVIAWYATPVLRLCFLLLGDEEEARDVFQETLLKLVQMVKQGRFRSANGSIKGFLMTTARNMCINRLRNRSRFASLKDEEDGSAIEFSHTDTPEEAACISQFEQTFDCALAKLSDIQRTVIVLHELNGESKKEIAETLSITVENVRMQLCRARKKMRVLLAPFVGEV